ncbi:hypothetical protein [Calothrix sp. NIES-3974]|uniref:hypothetical protein n=1 Tax=Calothrix sp. NIES-3974 TaxID=2005462 RepID=UPI00155FE49A|nr:hypothetical protein [Calothrix sp. NIES-3974]
MKVVFPHILELWHYSPTEATCRFCTPHSLFSREGMGIFSPSELLEESSIP